MKNTTKIAKMVSYTKEQVAVIKNTVAKGTNDLELAYFLQVCDTIGLNPFNKEIWCYKDTKGNLIVFTGRDGFLKKAQENPLYNGIRSCEVCKTDEFEADIPNGKIHHKFTSFDRGDIVGSYCIVFRKGGEPTIEIAKFSVFSKYNYVWKSNPADMIKKVAESKALKKAFGISGIQSEFDFDIKNNIAIPVEKIEQKGKIFETIEDAKIKYQNCKNIEDLNLLFTTYSLEIQQNKAFRKIFTDFKNKLNEKNKNKPKSD